MRYLISVGNRFNAKKVFSNMFGKTITIETAKDLPKDLCEDDAILFEGGEDVDPSMYNEPKSRFCGVTNLKRDLIEKEIFLEGIKKNVRFIGICRGAQFLCAMSGGKLIQHVNNHGQDHLISFKWIGEPIRRADLGSCMVTSTHHQMMYPYGLPRVEILAWSSVNRSDVYLGTTGNGDYELDHPDFEPEVVFFKDTRALAMQYHPEFMSSHELGVDIARQYVKDLFTVTAKKPGSKPFGNHFMERDNELDALIRARMEDRWRVLNVNVAQQERPVQVEIQPLNVQQNPEF